MSESVSYARAPDVDIDVDMDGALINLTGMLTRTDPSVRRRGRGFGPGAAEDADEGVKSSGFERLVSTEAGARTEEYAARCTSTGAFVQWL